MSLLLGAPMQSTNIEFFCFPVTLCGRCLQNSSSTCHFRCLTSGVSRRLSSSAHTLAPPHLLKTSAAATSAVDEAATSCAESPGRGSHQKRRSDHLLTLPSTLATRMRISLLRSFKRAPDSGTISVRRLVDSCCARPLPLRVAAHWAGPEETRILILHTLDCTLMVAATPRRMKADLVSRVSHRASDTQLGMFAPSLILLRASHWMFNVS